MSPAERAERKAEAAKARMLAERAYENMWAILAAKAVNAKDAT
jgi:hypothetical protein